MTTQNIDKEMLALQRNVGYKADSTKERIDEDLSRLARQSGIPINGYLPGKSRVFETPELVVDYHFDSELQQQSEQTKLPVSVYEKLSPTMIDTLKRAIKEECGGIPEIDDPLLEDILERHTKHKPRKAKTKHEKHDTLMALQQMYPYYNQVYPVFGMGYYARPLPDSDNDGIPDAYDTTYNTKPTPAPTENIPTAPQYIETDERPLVEEENIDWRTNKDGLVVITNNGKDYVLNAQQSASFKQQAMTLPVDSDELTELMKQFTASDLIEDVIEDVIFDTPPNNTSGIQSVDCGQQHVETARALIKQLGTLPKLSIADKCLINHLRAFVDRNSF